MPTLPDPYADVTARLQGLQRAAVDAYVRHARHPNRTGADVAHLKLWAQAYEVRSALAEQNPAVAQALLPAPAGAALPNALPLVPAGIRWQVDKPGAPGMVSVTLDVQGALSVSVQPPAAAALRPEPATSGGRLTFAFAAPADGLYRISLQAGSTRLASFYVPVTRAEFRLVREDSRQHRYQFRSSAPRPSDVFVGRLARLVAAEAAAQTGQAHLATDLLTSARALPPLAPTPTALFPARTW